MSTDSKYFIKLFRRHFFSARTSVRDFLLYQGQASILKPRSECSHHACAHPTLLQVLLLLSSSPHPEPQLCGVFYPIRGQATSLKIGQSTRYPCLYLPSITPSALPLLVTLPSPHFWQETLTLQEARSAS